LNKAKKLAEAYAKKAWQEMWLSSRLSWFMEGCPGEDGKLLPPLGPPSQELVNSVQMKALEWLEQRPTTAGRRKKKAAAAASASKRKKKAAAAAASKHKKKKAASKKKAAATASKQKLKAQGGVQQR
jgi:hypothetical protein